MVSQNVEVDRKLLDLSGVRLRAVEVFGDSDRNAHYYFLVRNIFIVVKIIHLEMYEIIEIVDREVPNVILKIHSIRLEKFKL